LPTLLEFTIYADQVTNLTEARRSASNDYIGVEGFTRGKGCSLDTPVPYEHDGADGAALIDWISKQPWGDGRVATFGPSYSGFTPWAHRQGRAAGTEGVDGLCVQRSGDRLADDAWCDDPLRLPVDLLHDIQ